MYCRLANHISELNYLFFSSFLYYQQPSLSLVPVGTLQCQGHVEEIQKSRKEWIRLQTLILRPSQSYVIRAYPLFNLNFLLKGVTLLFIWLILLYVRQDFTRWITHLGLKMTIWKHVHTWFTSIYNHGIGCISANHWPLHLGLHFHTFLANHSISHIFTMFSYILTLFSHFSVCVCVCERKKERSQNIGVRFPLPLLRVWRFNFNSKYIWMINNNLTHN